VPAVLTFTVLTLAVTLTHLGQLHLGSQHPAGTQIVTVAWIAIYVLVPALMLILLVVQARTPGADPLRSVGLPGWLYAVLAVQAIVLLGLGSALFAAPAQAASLWPWHPTPMMAPGDRCVADRPGGGGRACAGRTRCAPPAARRRRIHRARRTAVHRARPLPAPVPLADRLWNPLPGLPGHHAADWRRGPSPRPAAHGPAAHPIAPATPAAARSGSGVGSGSPNSNQTRASTRSRSLHSWWRPSGHTGPPSLKNA
jgi:hypothetical protein